LVSYINHCPFKSIVDKSSGSYTYLVQQLKSWSMWSGLMLCSTGVSDYSCYIAVFLPPLAFCFVSSCSSCNITFFSCSSLWGTFEYVMLLSRSHTFEYEISCFCKVCSTIRWLLLIYTVCFSFFLSIPTFDFI